MVAQATTPRLKSTISAERFDSPLVIGYFSVI
jgi:hypothetical protein